MSETAAPPATDPVEAPNDPRSVRIYLLPNLMTAGNLGCGFVAIIRCIQARQFELQAELAATPGVILPANLAAVAPDWLSLARESYIQAVWLLLAAVIFDLLDGRLARLGGKESPFGREFDSLADVVSFGVAPALMVFFLILSPAQGFPWFQQAGWFVGFLYLLCGAVRLARFNVLARPEPRTTAPAHHGSTDFIGLPIPAAAGTLASLVLVLLEHELPRWLGAATMAFLILVAGLMVSSVRYPSFKHVDWSTQTRLRSFLGLLVLLGLLAFVREVGLVLVFLAYILFGLGRHLRGARAIPASREQPAP